MLSQERLRALASELTLTEQRERRKLATDLHDYLAQLLVVGRMKLRRAATSMVDLTGSQLLHELDGVLQDSLQYTRTLITNLAPSTLQEFGLTHALHWLSEHMRSHGLTVHIKVEADSVDLPEDHAILVFQSVRELLFNVVKHAQVKSATVSCEITSDAKLRITVSDKGKGFDRQETVAEIANPGRFGLFSIGERMQAMGGRFEVESATGRGTRATMSLPYWPNAHSSLSDSVRDAKMERESTESATPARMLNQRPSQPFNGSLVSDGSEVPAIRVLLVDDHTMVRQGIRSLLDNHATIQVVGEASDGKQAIDLAKELRPDVVIMDVNLPIVDGLTATHEMRRDCPGTVVIALSVHDDQYIKDAMQQAGASAFVSKGSVTQELIEHVMRQLPVEQKSSP
jgi:CheY-like chemotaxis protein